jgi:CBS domain-containing protein/sporulation protein YlmC with PRC-barrel domain
MLHATEMLGAGAYDAQGNFVGRVKELFIDPGEQSARIARVLLSRGKFRPLVARYDQVRSVEPGILRLTTDEYHLEPYQPNDAWLAIGKDLLDQQIIDTNGQKVVRVNDLELSDTRTNGNAEMRITHVDVGLPGAMRRLFKGVVPPALSRKLQGKLPQRSIPWEFVNLVEPDPKRRVKLRLTHERLARLHPADLADIMEELSSDERNSIFASLDTESAAAAIAELDDRLKPQVLEGLGPDRAADILEEMPADEAADILEHMPAERSEQVLEEMEQKEAHHVRNLLQFEEHTAGGMMTTECVIVGQESTIAEVVAYLRHQESNMDQLDGVILLDTDACFAGVVPVARMVLAEAEQKMAALRAEPRLSVHPDADQKDVFELFDKYNLRNLAVVDSDRRPIGAITVDDVVERLRARA